MPENKSDSAKSDKSTTGVFDVAKPGATTPDSTSRPVVVGNRSVVKDPTIAPESTKEPAKQPTSSGGSSRKKIMPISSDQSQQTEANQPSGTSSDSTTQESPAAIVDAVMDQQVKKSTQQETIEAQEQAARAQQAKIKELIDKKKYFVHISPPASTSRIKQIFWWLAGLTILAAGGLALALHFGWLDAGQLL